MRNKKTALMRVHDRNIRTIGSIHLSSKGYAPTDVSGKPVDDLCDTAHERPYDLYLIDVNRSRGSADIEAVKGLVTVLDKRGEDRQKIVAFSGYGDLVQQARELGARAYQKPFNIREILTKYEAETQ
jgi:DNA-binding response OmpR family regulator